MSRASLLSKQGQYQVKPKLPFVPGSELSGTVTEVGTKVKSLKVGDRVCPCWNLARHTPLG